MKNGIHIQLHSKNLKKKISEGGNEYWGDFLLLNLLKEILNINFIVLYSNDILNNYYYYPLFYEYDKGTFSINREFSRWEYDIFIYT